VLSSEAVVMGVKAGIDPKVLIDIINAGSGRNSATQDKFPRAVLTRTFDFGFATGLSVQGRAPVPGRAEALGVPMVAGAAVRQMLAITQAKFGFDSDFTSSPRWSRSGRSRDQRLEQPRNHWSPVPEPGAGARSPTGDAEVMDKATFEKGREIRSKVLGKEFVDAAIKAADGFNLPMQELVTEYCWGAVWGREGSTTRRAAC
jgi:hypothetical protein